MASRSTRGTFVKVKHANQKRSDLSNLTERTLGLNEFKEAVRLPKGEDINEWVATHCVDFYNAATQLWECCYDDAAKFTQPGDGFPPNFEYRWADGSGKKSPVRCTGGEYVNFVFNWIEEQIQNETLFPVDEGQFDESFGEVANKIFTRIFRVYAIMYHSHFTQFERMDMAGHLNTSFKHLVFFLEAHGMIDEKEYNAIKGPVDRLVKKYHSG